MKMRRCIFVNLALLAGFFLWEPAHAQIICTQLGQFTSCDNGRERTTQADLGNGIGVIVGPRATTPYVILPTHPTYQHQANPRAATTAPVFVPPTTYSDMSSTMPYQPYQPGQ